MSRYRADWILPIVDAPLRNGWVSVEGGRITGLGSGGDGDVVDLGRAVVLPGLVNAHTHLELSYLHGRVPRGENFLEWVRVLMASRRGYPDPADPRIIESARRGLRQARATGTALIGDVSNTLVSVPLLREAQVSAQVFYELLGFTTPDPAARIAEARERVAAAGADSHVRISLAPHAPYSVSPALFAAIREEIDSRPGQVSSVHLGESPEEVELLKNGQGGWRTLLKELGVWNNDWRAPGKSPVGYLEDLGFLDGRVLVVHGVQFDGEDLSRLSALGATIVSCPRSNSYVGVGAPPLEAFYAMDVDVAFGTDSLASAPDLDLFAEIAEAHRLAPRVPARRLLESATLTGARALKFDAEFGTIEVGKRAELIVVRVPAGVTDVEEYLVSGVAPADVSWLEPIAGAA